MPRYSKNKEIPKDKSRSAPTFKVLDEEVNIMDVEFDGTYFKVPQGNDMYLFFRDKTKEKEEHNLLFKPLPSPGLRGPNLFGNGR